jgi:hypothetical protein
MDSKLQLLSSNFSATAAWPGLGTPLPGPPLWPNPACALREVAAATAWARGGCHCVGSSNEENRRWEESTERERSRRRGRSGAGKGGDGEGKEPPEIHNSEVPSSVSFARPAPSPLVPRRHLSSALPSLWPWWRPPPMLLVLLELRERCPGVCLCLVVSGSSAGMEMDSRRSGRLSNGSGSGGIDSRRRRRWRGLGSDDDTAPPPALTRRWGGGVEPCSAQAPLRFLRSRERLVGKVRGERDKSEERDS